MIKNKFKLSALAIVVGMAANGVYAAEQTAAEQTAAEKKAERKKAEAETEVIVVSGIRDSFGKALSHKRHADFGMDVISAEDIGKLPDVEIGDVLERIAGVQVDRNEDGVVSSVSVRGLPSYFNRTLYNGRAITTALSDERGFDAQIMPAAFMNRVEVHKTSVADVLEGGLAGIVNLKSIRAFDIGKEAFRFKGTASAYDNVDEINTDLLGVYSNLFLDETLGFTVGVNYLEADTESHRSMSSQPTIATAESANGGHDFNNDDDTADTFYRPRYITYQLDQNYRKRQAFFTNLEWRPTDDFRIFGEAFYSSYDTVFDRIALRFDLNPSDIVSSEDTKIVTSTVNDQEGTRDFLTAFQVDDARAHTRNQYNARDSDIAVGFIDAEWLLEQWTFKFGANIAKSKTTQFQIQSQQFFEQGMSVTLDGSVPENGWGITFNDHFDSEGEVDTFYNERVLMGAPLNPLQDNLALNGSQIGTEYENTAWGLDFDGEYEFSIMNDIFMPSYLKFGLHYAEDEITSRKYSGNITNMTDIAAFIGSETVDYKTIVPAKGEWFDGNMNAQGVPLPWTSPDIGGMVDKYGLNSNDFKQAVIDGSNRLTSAVPNDLSEEIAAAYVRLNFEANDGALLGNIGVRYVHTEQTVTGMKFSYFENIGTIEAPVIRAFGTGVETATRSYDNYLPSLNLRYLLGDSDDLVIRAAWSQTMTRPKRKEIEMSESFNNGAQRLTSPDHMLEEYISENVDLGIEWYYAESSAISLVMFYKDLQNLTNQDDAEKEYLIRQADEPSGSYLGPVLTRRFISIPGTIIQGATFAFEQPFTALPSFLSDTGIKMNYTYIDNSKPELINNIAKDNVSAMVYYDTKSFDARLSYTYRGEKAGDLGSLWKPDIYKEASSRLNVSFNYKPSKYYNIGLAVSNLTQETNVDYHDIGLAKSISDPGRRIDLSLTVRL